MVDWPWLSLGVCFSILICLAVLCLLTGLIAISEVTPREYLVWKDPIVVSYDERNLALEYVEKHQDAGSLKGVRSQKLAELTLLYENEKDSEYGLLRKDNLVKIAAIEQDMLQ